MHRSELTRRSEEMKSLQPEIEEKVFQYLREHPEDVFTCSDLRVALYPEWKDLTDRESDPKMMAMINAVRALEVAGKVESVHDCSGSHYYGLF